ncbi:MAG TPA: FtsW/RodA/SpoVE family cell cycle protein [Cyclobacteriaceae bacterium]|nr:FtsW/RodA/SpoVE family cell cycle protein [Cyclobacteriaceae bacterium]HMV08780.1 FtsW/RodA/SpoVE family cell cycle protein [Cyclobacteriaceae bacterium]HMV91318.1 FtsW/RodA/SpoVE family cell cycle protein [Cyclobacteriaceae bacterium]HMW99925.1 FtsW/RodA/SpoVE family cell cycle protein [Cyclobacteriaceae bacterium]HMX49212.1 FtsW/RodA/SpoVE family cell cycle protein [Cyclobacteriaceae bacterium]
MNKVKEWADKNLQGDKVIWAAVFGLSMISILVVYSSIGTMAYRQSKSTEWILLKHTGHILIGLAAMWIAHRIDYRFYSRLSKIGLWLSIPLLIYTFTNGVSLNDASRWIAIPLFGSFQPSDFASLVLIINIASMLAKRQQNIDDIKESLIPILMWCGIICGLIALTNLSTAILLLATCFLIMFIGRVPVKYLAMLVLVGVLAGAMALQFGVRGATAKSRITNFIEGKELPFQAKHARIAVATGGIAGKGPGNSDQRNILPHPYSDFIYAIVIEEYGMIGGAVVLGLYLLLLHRGMKAAYNSERAFAGLLSAGLSFDLVCQAMVNMGVVVGLGPITGQPLPFISMGGTSMIFTGLSVGIILSVSRGERDEVFDQKTKGEVKDKKENKNVEAVAA